jgi:2',3'-cyclic-nucleotide 2'-phosphodiesterase/3'-nucleotidase
MLERPVIARPLLATLLLALAACAAQSTRQSTPPAGTLARLALLETTDIHTNVLSYDYFRLTQDQDIGFERAAGLIRAARKEFENSLTFDAGDTIQGTSLADWQAQVKPLACDSELAVYKAMDEVGYDAGTIGNHEFNYGLAFLSRVTGTPFNIDGVPVEKCKGPHFPLVLGNVFSAKDGKPLYAPGASSSARFTRMRPMAARAT